MKAHTLTRKLLPFLLLSGSAGAQSPVLAFNAAYVSATGSVASYAATPATNAGSFTGCRTQNSRYTFSNGSDNALRLVDITVNSINYVVSNSLPATVKLRRVNNANVTGARSVVFLESVSAPAANCPANRQLNFKSPYEDNMETFLNNNFINQGTDNLFTNAGNGDGNLNNIERVDVIFSGGLTASNPDHAGFAFLDRGNKNGHDAFRVAAITALDANGDPASFGPVKTCQAGNGAANGSWGHPSLADGNRNISAYVLRKESTETRLKVSASVNQQLGGVFFSFADLGINPSQKIFGYAILGADGVANPTSSQLLNLANAAVYPTNTSESSGGGLDLIAVNAFFESFHTTLPVQQASLRAEAKNGQVKLEWSYKGMPEGSLVEVEGSADGHRFSAIHFFKAARTDSAGIYTARLADGQHFYRLRITAPSAAIYYSHIIRVAADQPTPTLYPSPAAPRQPIVVKGLLDDTYQVCFFSALGLVHRTEVVVQNGTGILQPPAGGYSKGLYYASFTGRVHGYQMGGKMVIN